MDRRDGHSSSLFRYVAFVVLVCGTTSYYSQKYIVGLQTTSVELFSRLAIPALALLAHFVLIRVLPFRYYAAAVAFDYVFLLAIATSHDYYQDNLDVHLILQNWREGLPFAGYIFQLMPKPLMVVAAGVAVVQCWLARGLGSRKINNRIILGLSIVLAAPYAYALRKEPIWRASLNQDYALCIKLYGYYGAALADLVVSGIVPSQDELLKGFLEVQARNPPVDPGWGVADACSRSVLALQVESLDHAVIDTDWAGRPVTPFLRSLKKNAALLRLSPDYSEASSSSGADFQVLTGWLPHPSFPIYGLTKVDYARALPRLFGAAGVDSFAFVGVTPNFFSQGAGFRRAGFKKHFDQSAYPATSARWGVDDKNFFEFNGRFLNGRRERSFYLMITVSSHGPFDFVEHDAFDTGTLAGRYMNSMHYVDEQLRLFLASLTGRHLVFLYGDHTANIRTPEYASDRGDGGQVPLFVFMLDDGVAARPEILGQPPAAPDPTPPLPLRSLYWIIRRSAIDGCEAAAAR